MFEQLIKLIRQEKVSAFIGAGFSIEASAPSVDKLKEIILKEFDDQELKKAHKDDKLNQLTEFYVNEICSGSRNQLISLMKKAFEFSPACMDDHKMLANIPHIKTIFTTNYDTLLEDSYPEAERDIVRNDVDCTYSSKTFKIVKVHGDFIAPDSVVITKSDYERFHKKMPNPFMWEMVETEFVNKHILFIGYSLEDDNILKIIKTISKNVGRNQKQMFLIAPGIKPHKQELLKKLGVKYFDVKANVFLKELTDSLLENISDDFRHNWISAETYTRFSFQHLYKPTVSIDNNGKNEIVNVKPIENHALNHKLNMTVNAVIGEKIKAHDFVKDGELVEGCELINGVPCFRLTGKDLVNCKHLINDVVLNKEISEIIIGPAENHLDLTVRIPNKDFFETIPSRSYRLNDKNLLIYADCHIFNLAINIVWNENKTKTLNFKFDFKKKYKDNNEAIKWIELPISLLGGADVYIDELATVPIKLKVSSKEVNIFDDHKLYYTTIKDIERLTHIKFKEYNGYTDNLIKRALVVSGYLKHEYVPVTNRSNGMTCKLAKIDLEHIKEKLPINQEISLVTTDTTPRRITLNDRVFTIPYVHEIYNNSKIIAIYPENLVDGVVKIDFQYTAPTYYVLYSKDSVEKEFPEMKTINEIFTDNE